MQIRRTKPESKAYTLGNGLGLSLFIKSNGSKSWQFRYRTISNSSQICCNHLKARILKFLSRILSTVNNWTWPWCFNTVNAYWHKLFTCRKCVPNTVSVLTALKLLNREKAQSRRLMRPKFIFDFTIYICLFITNLSNTFFFFYQDIPYEFCCGKIPTYVGTSRVLHVTFPYDKKHPHACGEELLKKILPLIELETPLRCRDEESDSYNRIA